ncbi:hypothetical protein [Shewanella salipaludis]|uniref:Uncharacterized protein n=1 Tax=Shewanella salipaludis TaxID=2723052 RepID=A0A972FZH5_9GAMM|nr:hypothetical protein [Shewanella salipaludis]NMH64711.1 hypothetical protein [Shewanella salipaludis]
MADIIAVNVILQSHPRQALTRVVHSHGRISESLRTLEKNIQSNLKQIKQEINRAGRMYDEDPIGFVHRLFGIPYYGRDY